MRDAMNVLGATRTASRQFAGPQSATVVRVDAGGVLYAELDVLPGAEFACHWSRPAAHAHANPEGGTTGTLVSPTPPRGTACLVLFAGSGADNAWVVAFDGWPA